MEQRQQMGRLTGLDGNRTFIRHLAVRRHAVHRVRQVLAELGQEVVGLHNHLAGHVLHLILAEHVLQLPG